MWVGNIFDRICLSVCLSIHLSVCLSVCSDYNFLTASHRNFIFGMEVHCDHIYIKFEYQGHWVKVKAMCQK